MTQSFRLHLGRGVAPSSREEALELIGLRWAGSVLWRLLGGPRRFNDLLHGIEGISDRVLTERLRDLGEAGLVTREVDAGPPVRVSYGLTGRGESLRGVLEAVEAWHRGAPPV